MRFMKNTFYKAFRSFSGCFFFILLITVFSGVFLYPENAFATPGLVSVLPDPPVRGKTVTVIYDPDGGPLESASPVFIHIGWNGWNNVISPDPVMTETLEGTWEVSIIVPVDAGMLDCAFHDENGNWDNNKHNDWHINTWTDPSTWPLGATLLPDSLGGGTAFRVWAPNAESLSVPGQFNEWDRNASLMTFDPASGIWSVFIPDAREWHEYKYSIKTSSSMEFYKNDPRARDTFNSNGNSIIRGNGDNYPWSAVNWEIPPHEKMVILELHVGTFSGEGDGVNHYPGRFRDIVDYHLKDIIALGVNMIEIMPIHEFPGSRSWGYNPVHFFAPESDYGAPDDLRYLVDTLHKNGIGVILDVVYNHTSTTENNLWNFDGDDNIYFFGDNCMGATPWGNTRPDFTEDEVRSFIVDNACYWIREFRMDGLRVDATSAMRGYCNDNGEGLSLMGEINEAVRKINPRAILIAEELPNSEIITKPVNDGGAGFDAQWCDPFNDNIRAQLKIMAGGGDPDIGSIISAISGPGFNGKNSQSVKYIESHDEAGNDKRITGVIDPLDPFSEKARDLAKVAGGLSILSPGIPMLFQGQEFLEDKIFDDKDSDRIDWALLNTYGKIRACFSLLISIRQERGSLKATSGIQITHVNEGANVFAFQRYDMEGDICFIIVNFGNINFSKYRIGIPSAGLWYELINTQDSIYMGSGTVNNKVYADSPGHEGLPASVEIILPPYSLIVFSKTPFISDSSNGFVLR
jgi:1,4-alpha-glucan branching enzyme